MSNLTKKIKQGICAYCGTVGDVTDDHVIPQCLWPGRVPKDIPIVDACRQCNHIEKSGNDAYLRDLLINDQDVLQSPHILKLWGRHLRAVDNNQSEMYHDRQNHSKLVMPQRPSGLMVPYLVSEVAEKRTRSILSLMICGLHHYYLHEPLPKDSSFWIGRLRTKAQIVGISNDIVAYSGEYHRGASHRVGDGTVFSCAYVELDTAAHTTLWQLTFYGTVVFGVMTNAIRVTQIESK